MARLRHHGDLALPVCAAGTAARKGLGSAMTQFLSSYAPRSTLKNTIAVVAALTLCLSGLSAHARDAARDLRRMVGYTIVAADTVSEVWENRSGDKIVKLSSGQSYRVSGLLLDPLSFTDVIVFAKKAGGSERLMVRLLIDNEAYDAVAVR